MKVTVIVGRGLNRHYESGFVRGLVENGLQVDFIGPPMEQLSGLEESVTVYDFFEGYDENKTLFHKLLKTLGYYLRLFHYAVVSDSKIIHLQWLNKFVYFDRTLVNVFYSMTGKKVVLTAHNIDAGERDGKSTRLNKATLRFMYLWVSQIIVHTEKSKSELEKKFNVPAEKVHKIPHGIMDMVPKRGLDRVGSREAMDLPQDKKILLFFGNITKYKGLDTLVEAMGLLTANSDDYLLVIAGMIKSHKDDDQKHFQLIRDLIRTNNLEKHLREMIHFIEDDDIEPLFMAADVLVLPYRHIFQSGVPFLSYHFGLPVVASDAGSFEEEIAGGRTGYIFPAGDAAALADTVQKYFNSELYENLENTRSDIEEYANSEFGWKTIGSTTSTVYERCLR